MTVIKYSLLNIKANKKPHIAIFLISVVVIFLLLCTSSMHEQVTSVMESDLRFNEYAAVAIRPISPTQIVDNNADLTDEHIARFSDSEYVVNFYAFTQLSVGSNSLYPTTVPFERALQASLLPMFDRQFELIIYSDIHMSTHFVLGDRKLAQGRFAENTTESMVSSEMADKNNLAVGDFISIYTSHHAPGKLTFEIVGIYYDFSADIGNELNLVLPRLYEFRENPEPGIDFTFRTEWASRNNLSRNQILTVASSSAEQTSLRMRGLFGGQQNAPVLPNDWGYDVVVFYVRDEQSIPAFIHSIEDILHEHHTIFDSGDMLRYISNTLDFTQRTFALLLTGALAA
ncbi:MAG: hypothetical protein FWF80_02135, partial [Defluviitaleaceae bacterium]|nr:hypothetical protein [Defluviitaleaceae bacterium]